MRLFIRRPKAHWYDLLVQHRECSDRRGYEILRMTDGDNTKTRARGTYADLAFLRHDPE